jgi:hypothetical protein
VVYVHGRGKSAGLADIEQIVRAGAIVLSIDARGTGETQFSTGDSGSDFPRYFGDYHSAMKALLLGRPLAGMRAQDLARAIDLLVSRPEVDRNRIWGFGRDAGALPLLYAAVLDGRLKRLALEGMLLSYESVVTGKIHRGVFESVVPGALRRFDVPDLAAALAPRPVWVVNAANPLGSRVPLAEARRQYARGPHIQVKERASTDDLRAIYAGLLE